jgi:ribonuclease HI
MAKELGASVITIRSDSQLMVSQIKGDYMAKEPILQKYLAKVKESLQGLSGFEIQHIPREQNHRADILSKLASTKNVSYRGNLAKSVYRSPNRTKRLASSNSTVHFSRSATNRS